MDIHKLSLLCMCEDLHLHIKIVSMVFINDNDTSHDIPMTFPTVHHVCHFPPLVGRAEQVEPVLQDGKRLSPWVFLLCSVAGSADECEVALHISCLSITHFTLNPAILTFTLSCDTATVHKQTTPQQCQRMCDPFRQIC